MDLGVSSRTYAFGGWDWPHVSSLVHPDSFVVWNLSVISFLVFYQIQDWKAKTFGSKEKRLEIFSRL